MITVDPGVHACGVAIWTDRGALSWAGYIPVEELTPIWDEHGGLLVIEMPRIYPGSGQQKGDLNDLLDLATVVGHAEAIFGKKSTIRVFPGQWKGQVPKKIMTARIQKHMTPLEHSRVEWIGAKDHNTLDAIGIGLWRLGRL